MVNLIRSYMRAGDIGAIITIVVFLLIYLAKVLEKHSAKHKDDEKGNLKRQEASSNNRDINEGN